MRIGEMLARGAPLPRLSTHGAVSEPGTGLRWHFSTSRAESVREELSSEAFRAVGGRYSTIRASSWQSRPRWRNLEEAGRWLPAVGQQRDLDGRPHDLLGLLL